MIEDLINYIEEKIGKHKWKIVALIDDQFEYSQCEITGERRSKTIYYTRNRYGQLIKSYYIHSAKNVDLDWIDGTVAHPRDMLSSNIENPTT